MSKIFTLQNISFVVFLSFACGLVLYILLCNLAPWGITMYYTSDGDNNKNISRFTPTHRITTTQIDGKEIIKQIEDLVYFTTKMPFHFDTATIKLTFKNQNANQKIYLGFQDQEEWHFNTQLIDYPVLNSLSWNTLEDNVVLFQKQKKFRSVKEFLNDLPLGAIIATVDVDEILNHSTYQISNYTPARSDTIISNLLRGGHILYAYVENEPFRFNIQTQDLNWYEGKDPVVIRIYKGEDLVHEARREDDGIADSSRRVLDPREISIQNPGPELPENGIYKIVINASADIIINKISTNLHKIVFADHIFLASNHKVYSPIATETKPTILFTNAQSLHAKPYHLDAVQTIMVGETPILLQRPNHEVTVPLSDVITQVRIPKNDIYMQALFGYFALENSQFFNPTPYYTFPVTGQSDLEFVDYVLASYKPSKTQQDGWQIAEVTFDISTGIIHKGMLNWMIKAPGLKEHNRSLLIKKIEVIFRKKPVRNTYG